MYFWNINKLKSDFNEGSVTEKSILQYLIAYTVLFGIAMIPFGEKNQFDMLSAALMIPLSVLGIFYAYACNGGDTGADFLAKYCAIGWVVTIRFIAILIPVSIVLGIILGLSGVDFYESTTLMGVLLDVTITALLLWRIAVHIQQTTLSSGIEQS